MSKTKMTRDVVPEGFTLGLAAVDAVPVLFFCAAMVLAGMILESVVFIVGSVLCLYAGACKVLWKVIVVKKKKNIWWMFLQMRIVMPIGMILMLISVIFGKHTINMAVIWQKAYTLPASGFFAAGIAGMVLMMVFAVKLDSSDVKANWIEQITNGFAQCAFFIGLLLVKLL